MGTSVQSTGYTLDTAFQMGVPDELRVHAKLLETQQSVTPYLHLCSNLVCTHLISLISASIHNLQQNDFQIDQKRLPGCSF